MVSKDVTPGRCLSCRSEVMVPNHFADGDIMQCAVCRMSLKIVRSSAGGNTRLVIADVTPLRDEIKSIELRVSGLESDLRRARASLGIGANGFGLGVLYVIAQVMLENSTLSRELFLNAVAIAIASGIGLELANFFFLAKRREMSRLSAEIDEATSEIRQLQAKIRESVRK
jgi:hypothetical protein